MDAPQTPPATSEDISPAENLGRAPELETDSVIHKANGQKISRPKNSLQPHDFGSPTFLSTNEMRKLRAQQEQFVQSLASRLSVYLRMEFTLELVKLQTMPFGKFAGGLSGPVHLTLFKVEPLTGVGVLNIHPTLGLTMVDRFMGGPGQSDSAARELSDIEVALLDQAAQIVVTEWCGQWAKEHDLRPALLGHENSARFLQSSTPDTVMLVIGLEATLGECRQEIQIALSRETIEPLIEQLRGKPSEIVPDKAAPILPAKWSRHFDDINVAVTADWRALELTVGALTRLRIGDVLPLSPDFASEIRLSLAEVPKFEGRLGTRGAKWAVEINRVCKT